MKKINLVTVTPYIIIVLLMIPIYILYNKSTKLSRDVENKNKLISALTDTISTYKNERNELVSEKLTLQFELKDKTFENLELVQRIKETEKKNATLERKVTVFAAALVESQVTIDSLQKSYAHVSVSDSSMSFTAKTEFLEYDIRVNNVFPSLYVVPKLTFDKFSLSNKQFIEFHWKNEPKDGYPVSFSISNSNPYFKINDIESYAIPEINKEDIKPNFWQKTWKIIKKSSGDVIIFGVGLGTGLIIK